MNTPLEYLHENEIGTPILNDAGEEIGRRYSSEESRELMRRFETAPGFPRDENGAIDYDKAIRQTIDEHDKLNLTTGMMRDMVRRESGFSRDDLTKAYNRYLRENGSVAYTVMEKAVKALKQDMGEEEPEVDKVRLVLEIAALSAWAALIVWRIVR